MNDKLRTGQNICTEKKQVKKNDYSVIPRTAYVGQAAKAYDEIRFIKKHGMIFNDLEFLQLMEAASQISPKASVLEVGCGTARFSQLLAKQGFAVVASDPSPDMLQVAKNKCTSLDNIEFVLAESASLHFPTNFFDFVFAIRVLNQTESENYAILSIVEMIRVTKENGLILIEFVNKSRPFSRRNNSTRLTFNQISEIAQANECLVLKKSGILVFSQTVLDLVPTFLLPIWKNIEIAASKVLWRIASRGYVLLKKVK